MRLKQAHQLARKVKATMEPFCERIAIAGSIRRKKEEVKDIEIVMIPKMANSNNRSTGWIKAIRSFGYIYKGDKQKGGVNVAKYIQTAMGQENIKIDFFIATPENWSMTYLIRTGPADFSASILLRFNTFGYRSVGSIPTLIKDPDIKLSFESEEKIFDFLNLPYLEPEIRDLAKIRGITQQDLVQFGASQKLYKQSLIDADPGHIQGSLF